MDLTTFKCPHCDAYEASNLDSIRIHCQKRHSLPARQLYVLLFLPDGKEPTCACGCGEQTKFISLQKGFSEYVLGHSSRVKNNWGHNKEALNKSLKKRRDEGLWNRDPWNRGKTKENDPEFAKIAEKAYGNEDFKKRRSEIMSQNRLNKTVPDLKGSAHPNWRGGTSALQPLVRSHIHNVWVYPKLKASGFRCSTCSSTSDLVVHHDQERFAAILHRAVEALGEPGESFQKKSLIAEWVANYHVDRDVSGVVLCHQCHEDVHRSEDHTP